MIVVQKTFITGFVFHYVYNSFPYNRRNINYPLDCMHHNCDLNAMFSLNSLYFLKTKLATIIIKFVEINISTKQMQYTSQEYNESFHVQTQFQAEHHSTLYHHGSL